MSSAEPPHADDDDALIDAEPTGPTADDVRDPALRAEIANPGDSNRPDGTEAEPSPTAPDEGPIDAAGAPQGVDRDTVPAQGTGDPTTTPVDEAGGSTVEDETGLEGVQGDDAPLKGPELGGRESDPTPAAVAPSDSSALDGDVLGTEGAQRSQPDAYAAIETTAADATGTAGTDVVEPADLDPSLPSQGDASALNPEQPEQTASASADDFRAADTASPATDPPSDATPVDASTADDAPAAEATPVAPEELAPDLPAGRDAGPPPEPDVLDERRQPLLDGLRDALGDAVLDTYVKPGLDAWVRIRTDAWRAAADVCRNTLGLTYFGYLSAIDWLPSPFGKSEQGTATTREQVLAALADLDPAKLDHGYTGGETRFQLIARVHSVKDKVGITLKCDVPDDAPIVESWTGIYPGANWHEREAAEMFGIGFAGHPYLVKLYLPGDFEGFPLRKDFPLLAREVKPWPGLVDVEAMPGEDPEAADEAAEAAEV